MTPEKTAILCKKYPKLFRQHKLDKTVTSMCWGFECGDGWFKLIDELCAKLIQIVPEAQASQVKEKFGTLRFYLDGSTEEAERAIEEAERLSAITCEMCGAPGSIRGKQWVSTLCDACNAKDVPGWTIKGNSPFGL